MPRFLTFFLIFWFSAYPSVGKAQTVVSLKPNITKTLIDLGAAQNIVGLTRFCDKANPSAKIVADYQTIDVEAVLRLKPDYVILSEENTQKRQFESLTNTLKNTSTHILLLSFGSLDELFDSYLKLAKIWNKEHIAQNRIDTWKNQLALLQTQDEWQHVIAKKKFAVIVQRSPLIVAGGQTYIHSLFSTLGLENVFAKNRIAYPTLNPEQLLLQNIDYLFDMSHEAIDDPVFLGKTVIPLTIADYLAHPQSLDQALAWAKSRLLAAKKP